MKIVYPVEVNEAGCHTLAGPVPSKLGSLGAEHEGLGALTGFSQC